MAAGRALLVIEDQERIANFLVRGLRAEGYAVIHCVDGAAALATARGGGFAAIVLDVMLPGPSGTEVCQILRMEGDTTPILMLSALDTVEQRVEGLQVGADDYLTKPFAVDELLARLAALIRRDRGFRADARVLRAGDIEFDRSSLTVSRSGLPLR